MGIIRKWIQALTVPIDEETGQPLVKVTGITFDKDVDIGDVTLLDAAGTKINPATSEGQAAIAGKIPAMGQAVAGASLPVVLPASQISTLTPPAAITNFANETGGNLAAIKAALTVPTEKPPAVAEVDVAAGPTATPLAANDTFALGVMLIAKGANAHSVLFGTAAGQVIPIAPGSSITLNFALNTKVDLNDLYINGTAGEGVYVFYQTA